MATKWEEIVTDRNLYPDDHVLKLADGTEVKLGDVRPGYMKDADYRRKTSDLARDKDRFEAEAVQRVQQIQEGEAQLRAIAAELIRQNPGMTKKEAVAEITESDDPTVLALRREIAGLKAEIDPLKQSVTGIQDSAKAARAAYVIQEHRKALQDLKAKNPDMDEAEVVNYAQRNMVPNLYHAWTLMNHDKIVEAKAREVREAAIQEGYAKAKAEYVSPALPMRRTPEVRPADAPKNMNDAVKLALRDPEVMSGLLGQG